MMKMRGAPICVAVVASLWCSASFGAGFEKAIMFSGRYAGVGNAVTSWVSDSEALYFNPAGLAAAKGLNLSANFSPTVSSFKGPIYAPNQSVESDQTFSPVAGAFASNNYGRLGLGIGAYLSGGTKAIYENVDFSPIGFATLKPTIQSDLTVFEFSAGGGYEVAEGLRLGAGYRIILVNAKLGTVKVSPASAGPPPRPATLTEIQLTDLKDTAFNGFRLGLQYAPENAHWGIGAAFRSEVSFAAEGKSGGRILAVPPGGAPLPLTGGTATVRNTFPLQALFGVHCDVSPALRLALDYDFTRYSKNSVLDLEGSFTLPTVFDTTQTPIPLADITQGWLDQHNLRIGGEYTTVGGWALRAGYILTSKVPPKEFARPTFSSPGFGHSILLGAGREFHDSPLRLDLAGEYSFASGTVGVEETAIAGKYSSQAFIAHVGLSYSLKNP